MSPLPIRDPEAEHVGIEIDGALHVVHAIGHVAELDRHDAGLAHVLLGEVVLGEDLDPGILRDPEDDGVGHAGRDVALALRLDPVLGERMSELAEIAARRDLEGEARERIGATGSSAIASRPCLLAKIARSLFAINQREADDLGVVADLASMSGVISVAVAKPAHCDHSSAPVGTLTRYRAHSRARAMYAKPWTFFARALPFIVA